MNSLPSGTAKEMHAPYPQDSSGNGRLSGLQQLRVLGVD